MYSPVFLEEKKSRLLQSVLLERIHGPEIYSYPIWAKMWNFMCKRMCLLWFWRSSLHVCTQTILVFTTTYTYMYAMPLLLPSVLTESRSTKQSLHKLRNTSSSSSRTIRWHACMNMKHRGRWGWPWKRSSIWRHWHRHQWSLPAGTADGRWQRPLLSWMTMTWNNPSLGGEHHSLTKSGEAMGCRDWSCT